MRYRFLALLLLLLPSPALAQPACALPETLESRACARALNEAPYGRRGDFDSYLLALSWSPAYCANAGRSDAAQCEANRFGFVVHGLWPQYAASRHAMQPGPFHCGAPPLLPTDILKRHFCRMPGQQLMQCEWAKHGSCGDFSSGADYLATIERLAAGLTFPQLKAQRMKAEAIARAFADANKNAKLKPEHIAVQIRNGELIEIRLCYARDLKDFIACDKNAGGARPEQSARIRPP